MIFNPARIVSMIALVAILAAVPALLGQQGPTFAQHSHGDHKGHGAKASSDSTKAYQAAMDAMHTQMAAVSYTGDADTDLLTGMIPHHQGAIDMAQVALKFGKDPEVRKLAEKIIAAQVQEIAEMKEMLKKRGK